MNLLDRGYNSKASYIHLRHKKLLCDYHFRQKSIINLLLNHYNSMERRKEHIFLRHDNEQNLGHKRKYYLRQAIYVQFYHKLDTLFLLYFSKLRTNNNMLNIPHLFHHQTISNHIHKSNLMSLYSYPKFYFFQYHIPYNSYYRLPSLVLIHQSIFYNYDDTNEHKFYAWFLSYQNLQDDHHIQTQQVELSSRKSLILQKVIQKNCSTK